MDPKIDTLVIPINGVKIHRAKSRNGLKRNEEGFWCRYCGAYVHNLPTLSGVQNRNHCPYCLWSRHLDLWQAGDRLSACKAGMQPIGLTQKRSINKYGKERCGELMLVHRCSECGGMSINRIAADDSADGLISVFRFSFDLDTTSIERLEQQGIHLLRIEETSMVERQICGDLCN